MFNLKKYSCVAYQPPGAAAKPKAPSTRAYTRARDSQYTCTPIETYAWRFSREPFSSSWKREVFVRRRRRNIKTFKYMATFSLLRDSRYARTSACVKTGPKLGLGAAKGHTLKSRTRFWMRVVWESRDRRMTKREMSHSNATDRPGTRYREPRHVRYFYRGGIAAIFLARHSRAPWWRRASKN